MTGWELDTAFQAMVSVSEEIGLYEAESTVCTTHKTFTPCRHGESCELSGDTSDIALVMRHQRQAGFSG